jgi:hypothetical protein
MYHGYGTVHVRLMAISDIAADHHNARSAREYLGSPYLLGHVLYSVQPLQYCSRCI